MKLFEGMAISEFVRQYIREQDFYARVAELCGRRLEDLARESNIRTIVSWRAKRPDRLQRKLEERALQRAADGRAPYASADDIYEDVPDLAGARVALYFPRDADGLEDLIRAAFRLVREPKSFPLAVDQLSPGDKERRGTKRFAGYAARHYRVTLPPESLSKDDKRFADGRCEIQVASVLMHAWAEVEHDLEYKRLSGSVSELESMLLDQINGLVIAGEMALDQLRTATAERLAPRTGLHQLRDQFDLANWLRLLDSSQEVVVGRADVAYRFLELLSMTKVADLERLRERVAEWRSTSSASLADSLVEVLLRDEASREDVLIQAKKDVAAREHGMIAQPEATLKDIALGRFLQRWRALEVIAVSLLSESDNRAFAIRNLIATLDGGVNLAYEHRELLRELMGMRNRAVHGHTDSPTAAQLLHGEERLDSLLNSLLRLARSDEARIRLQHGIEQSGWRPSLRKGTPPIEVSCGPLIVNESYEVIYMPIRVVNRPSGRQKIESIFIRHAGAVHPAGAPPRGWTSSQPVFADIENGLELVPNEERRGVVCFDVAGNALRLAKAPTLTVVIRFGTDEAEYVLDVVKDTSGDRRPE